MLLRLLAVATAKLRGYKVRSFAKPAEWKQALSDQIYRERFDRINTLFENTVDPIERARLVEIFTPGHKRPDFFDLWLQDSPNSGHAYLVRGSFRIKQAWDARTSSMAEDVKPEAWGIFRKFLQDARNDLDHAQSLLAWDPLVHAQQIVCDVGLSDRSRTRQRFSAAIQQQSDHWETHCAMLMHLCKKWGGSHEEMFGFARTRCRSLHRGHALTVLIPMAHFERWMYAARFDMDQTMADRYWKDRKVRDEIVAAYRYGIGYSQHAENEATLVASDFFAYALDAAQVDEMAIKEFERIGKSPGESPWGLDDFEIVQFAKKKADLKRRLKGKAI